MWNYFIGIRRGVEWEGAPQEGGERKGVPREKGGEREGELPILWSTHYMVINAGNEVEKKTQLWSDAALVFQKSERILFTSSIKIVGKIIEIHMLRRII